MPGDKAPGPDGFTGLFCRKCWDIIKGDLMNVIHLFGSLHAENFHWLNSANIVLLPKKDGAEDITDFRPISLIHAVANTLCFGIDGSAEMAKEIVVGRELKT
jgi:mannosylglycoprotein endo-beta-mannosidase